MLYDLVGGIVLHLIKLFNEEYRKNHNINKFGSMELENFVEYEPKLTKKGKDFSVIDFNIQLNFHHTNIKYTINGILEDFKMYVKNVSLKLSETIEYNVYYLDEIKNNKGNVIGVNFFVKLIILHLGELDLNVIIDNFQDYFNNYVFKALKQKKGYTESRLLQQVKWYQDSISWVKVSGVYTNEIRKMLNAVLLRG